MIHVTGLKPSASSSDLWCWGEFDGAWWVHGRREENRNVVATPSGWRRSWCRVSNMHSTTGQAQSTHAGTTQSSADAWGSIVAADSERDIFIGDKLHREKWISDHGVNTCWLFVLVVASPGSLFQEQQHAYRWGLWADDPRGRCEVTVARERHECHQNRAGVCH